MRKRINSTDWLAQEKFTLKFTREIYSAFTLSRLGGIGFFEPPIALILSDVPTRQNHKN